MYLFYDCLYFLAALVYLPVLFLRGKWHSGLLLRCGGALSQFDFSDEKRKNIWVHAVSIGEVNAITPLIEKLRARPREMNVFLTVTTKSGYKLARQKWQNTMPVLWSPSAVYA